MTESNEKDVKYDLTEILKDFRYELSIDALMYKSKKYKFLKFISIVIVLLPQLILVHYIVHLVKQVSFAYYFIHVITYLIALFISFVISICFILNRYAKDKARVLLRTKKKTGFLALFTFWPSKAVRNYQKTRVEKYFEKKRITELSQYEFLSERIQKEIKIRRPTLPNGFGIVLSIFIALFVQINQLIISNVSTLSLIISWELAIITLILSVWFFINQVMQFYYKIINTDNQLNEQFNSLLKEIIFEMKMKKCASPIEV